MPQLAQLKVIQTGWKRNSNMYWSKQADRSHIGPRPRQIRRARDVHTHTLIPHAYDTIECILFRSYKFINLRT